jgi:hypothetical protein
MRTLAFWATVLAVVGLASPARSESIYRYRDPNTKRDVFVTRLDQIPAPYREQAKLVVADGVLVDSSNQPAKDVPLGAVIYGRRTPAGAIETIERAVSDVWNGERSAGGLLRTLTTAIDTALVGAGRRPLSAGDVARIKRTLVEAAVALAMASLLASVALILVMAHAFRAEHRWWMVLILLFQLPGIAYVLLHVESKRRWFKFATLLAQTAPYAVVLATGWRFAVFFRALLAGS